ncbi:MAG: alpha/beta hydrolase fold domain-containing protein [Sandaracinaceae bacterium]|nr:alpha/beta hydrolase fold domain-containing protein [Sandaracinaceae bacterium]
MGRWLLALAMSLSACGAGPEDPQPSSPPPPPAAPSAPAAAPAPESPPADPPAAVGTPIVQQCVPPTRTETAPRLQEGIVYSRPGGRALALDLARPAGAGPHPVVLVFHGGGWSAGERAHVRDDIATLATLGYAGAAVDYRLVDGRRDTSPAQVADARCAVRYLRGHAAELGLDPDRMAALGYSAGGHLALMLATGSDVSGLDAGCADVSTSPHVRAAIGYFPPVDLRPEAEFSRPADGVITRLLGTTRRRDPAAAALVSPLVHVDGGDASVLLVHGTADRVVPYQQALDMQSALERAGVPVTLVPIPEGQHGFRLFGAGARIRPGTCTALAFLRANLAPRDL